MDVFVRVFLSLVTILLLGACGSLVDTGDSSASPDGSATTIMPLGASRVEGNRPEFESFRYELWKRLVENGWDFDFVGTRADEAEYAEFGGFSFDVDHQGTSGWTSGQILEELGGWLSETGAPDVVLLSSPGGNDALEGLPFDEAVANVTAVIGRIQEANPNVTIVVEQMAPAATEVMTGDLAGFIEQMQREVLVIANDQTTDSSRIIAVDMFTGFGDDLLADDVHYNERGAMFIADKYYAVLEDVLASE